MNEFMEKVNSIIAEYIGVGSIENKFFREIFDIDPNHITAIVLYTCGVLFVVSLLSLLAYIPFSWLSRKSPAFLSPLFSALSLFCGKIKKFSEIIPALMVSAGIIGTFWGTFIALDALKFTDASEMIDKIPDVVSAMTTAFITSLIGLLSGFATKIWLQLLPKEEVEIHPVEKKTLDLLEQIKEGIGGKRGDNLHSQMHGFRSDYKEGTNFIKDEFDILHTEMKKIHDSLVSGIGELKEAISGESNSSVVSHLVKVRGENNANFASLNKISGNVLSEITEFKTQNQDSIDKLHNAMYALNQVSDKMSDGIASLRGENEKNFDNLQKAIGGLNEESAKIVAEIAELKKANERDLDKLHKTMDGLAETIKTSLVESVNALKDELRKAIIEQLAPQLEKTNELLREQLTKMVKEIQKALIEQFGKTFVEFNEATQAIRKWQEDHRHQVEQLTAAFNTTANGIEKIRADCESIPATMEQLRTLMGELNERLRAFAEMKKQAEESFPAIKGHLDKIGKDLEQSAAGFDGLEKTIEKFLQDTENALTSLAEQYAEKVNEHAEKIDGHIEKMSQEWGENMVGIAERCAEAMRRAK